MENGHHRQNDQADFESCSAIEDSCLEFACPIWSNVSPAFSGGARSAFKLKEKRLIENLAIAPSAVRLYWISS